MKPHEQGPAGAGSRPISAWNRLGALLQGDIDGVARAVTGRPLLAALLGAGLGLAAVIGGLSAFILVWALLVGVIHRL